MYPSYFNMQAPMTMNGQYPNFPQQKQEIVKVNGENGARAYQMMPNSSALLLDESNPIVWLIQTDGAGYKSVSAYSITPYQNPQTANLASIEERITKLEEIVNAKSDTSSTKSKKTNE